MKAEFGFSVPLLSGANDNLPRAPCAESIDFRAVKDATILCDNLGYNALYVADHLSMSGTILEGWTVVSSLSSVTKNLRLGTIHISNLFRNPALLAKMAATLDFISNGRLDFFIDAGHLGSREETVSYGLPWSDNEDVRARMLDEAITLILQIWSKDRASFEGRYYSVKEATCEPKPVQQPHPPIWIGISGDEPFTKRRTSDELMIKAAAKHADVWNTTPASVEYYKVQLRRLEEECNSIGRNFDEMNKSLETQVFIAKDGEGVKAQIRRLKALNPRMKFFQDFEELKKIYVIGTPEECIDRIEEYCRLGITKFMIWFGDLPSLDGIRQFAESVIPQFR